MKYNKLRVGSCSDIKRCKTFSLCCILFLIINFELFPKEIQKLETQYPTIHYQANLMSIYKIDSSIFGMMSIDQNFVNLNSEPNNGLTNPYVQQLHHCYQRVNECFDDYEKLFDSKGNNNKNKPDKNLIKKSGLAKALKEYGKVKEKYAKLQDFLNTLRIIAPADFHHFNNLTDQKGDSVKISIRLSDEYNPSNFSGIKATTVLKPIGNRFKYDSDGSITDFEVVGVNNNEVEITLWANGISLPVLCNELSDVRYFFENVHDKKSLEYFEETGHGKNAGYFDDPNGTGMKSELFEREIKRKLKEYLLTNKL